MKTTFISILIIVVSTITSCKQNTLINYKGTDSNIIIAGRTETVNDEIILIGSASSATMYFTGDTCTLLLRNVNSNGLHNYYSIELDTEDLGRFRIDGDTTIRKSIEITFKKDLHKISVYKSTEAMNQYIAFGGISCEKLIKPLKQPQYSIEFIGNSITCGMGNDTLNIPCNKNEWYDQHNAYWAYGPTVSRAINAKYTLSSVSGIGIYRNWNDVGPVMPQVYENLYLNQNTNKKYNFSSFIPDIVSICLGTNDLSDGDGINERLPFDSNKFTENYIKFVETILSHYPETQVALLSSPMIKDFKHEILLNCLNDVKKHFDNSNYKPIEIFEFNDVIPHGCDYHPDINDHIIMADQLLPFYIGLLKK